jgi:hypothetical protein
MTRPHFLQINRPLDRTFIAQNLSSTLQRRLAGRVSPGNALLEQLSFPFFQKAVDFYDEFMEFLRVVLVGSLLAEFAPAFFFFADHPDNPQLSGVLNGPLCHKRAMLYCSVSYF